MTKALSKFAILIGFVIAFYEFEIGLKFIFVFNQQEAKSLQMWSIAFLGPFATLPFVIASLLKPKAAAISHLIALSLSAALFMWGAYSEQIAGYFLRVFVPNAAVILLTIMRILVRLEPTSER